MLVAGLTVAAVTVTALRDDVGGVLVGVLAVGALAAVEMSLALVAAARQWAQLRGGLRRVADLLTEAELVLWEVLKGKKLKGRKFRRQFSIGYYIADFYCPSERLVIELDGQHHYTPEGKKRDLERDENLEELNIKVLRFKNKEVMNNLTAVLRQIKSSFET